MVLSVYISLQAERHHPSYQIRQTKVLKTMKISKINVSYRHVDNTQDSLKKNPADWGFIVILMSKHAVTFLF